MEARVYDYGAKPPTEGATLVWDQSRLAHRYRNRLCELELERRSAAEAALRAKHPRVAELQARVDVLAADLEAARAAVKAANATVRRRSATAKPDRAKASAALDALRICRRELKDARKEAWADPLLKVDLQAIDAAHVAAVKAARAANGLYWGNYLRVEQAAGSMRTGAPPRYQRWHGEACVTVQIQGGMTLAEAMSGRDMRFRLSPWSPAGPIAADPCSARSRRGGWSLAYVRVGSAGRLPVWATAPVRLHRLPPDDARIKWVHLRSRKVGTRQVWALQMVVESAAGFDPGDRADCGAAGVDLGWRLLGDGSLRVAYWCGDDGDEGQVVTPARDLQRWDKAEQLRSIRDRMIEEIRPQLAAWLAGRDLPDWLRERAATLPHWRSTARLAALVLHWRANRFAGDEEIYAAVEAWRAQDRHLYDWEASQVAKAQAWRTDLYRRFAADLSRRYATAVIEDIDWRDLARRPTAESEDVAYASRQRRLAAPGAMAECLRQRCRRVVAVPAAGTTRLCHACGSAETWDQSADLVHTCGGCGATWDQDRNAAMNLLDAASGEVVDETPGSARNPQPAV